METVGTYAVVPFISGLFNVLIDRLAPENLREWLIGRESTAAELVKLRSSIMVVKRVVHDAEKRQDMDLDVRTWLNDVKHAVYDAEDLVDHIHTEALENRMMTESPQEVRDVRSSFTAILGRIVAVVDPFHERQLSRIQEINRRFNALTHLIDGLGLRFGLEQTCQLLSSRLTSGFVDESRIYGRDSEREQIIKFLEDGFLRDYDQGRIIKVRSFLEDDIRVISIVGMPGIGKTTLAQLVFNDPRVDEIFNMKSWTCIPRVFDAIHIIRKILNVLPETSLQLTLHGNSDDLQLHQKILRERVAGKRILIVLDDLWDETLNTGWQDLLISLKTVAPGSSIIVTTRNEDIARMLHPIFTLRLLELPDDDVRALFNAHAFGDPQAVQDVALESIGRKAVAKCRGLPLASKALGRLLSFTSDAKEWETIASSRLWDLPSGKKEILPALLLSYNYLPPHLKRCFAYCSIFPKNYYFDKEKLVLLWMAEGFVEQARNDHRRVEDIGKVYFHDLLARSFFQVSNSMKHYFVMHDLIHDLAVYVMGEFGSMLESNFSNIVVGTPRHIAFTQSEYDSVENYMLSASAYQLRTLLPVRSFSTQACYYLSNCMLQSVKLFGHLRVLSLSGYKITNIPSSIGALKLLRYLDFSFTFIEKLPDSICDLLNLQTLLLAHCQRLKKLPAMIRNLIHLRHLDIRGTCNLSEIPEHIGRLSCLQTLTDFVIGEDGGRSIRELGELLQLRGSLRLSGLENVVAQADAFTANLRDKVHLDELALVQRKTCFVTDRQHERLLDALKPHTHLRRLTIEYYEGNKFPDWLGDEAFSNLEVLSLKKCLKCVNMPPLGKLPSLRYLLIKDFDKLETLGDRFYGQHSESSLPFKSLVTLKFDGLQMWKKWPTHGGEVGPFPCLKELYVWNCKELEGGIPLELPSLVVLDIRNCEQLSGSLPCSLDLCELRLDDFGSLDLTSLACLTHLTDLSLCWEGPVESASITKVQEVLPLLTSLESVILESKQQWAGLIDPKCWRLPSSVRSVTVIGCTVEEIDSFLEGCQHLQYLYFHTERLDSSPHLSVGNVQLLNYVGIVDDSSSQESQITSDGDDFGLESLYDLEIVACDVLNTFPAGRLRAARNLTTLSLVNCHNLKWLPYGMAACFPCLQFISIEHCPLSLSFPEDDLPPQLQSLRLEFCWDLESLSDRMSFSTSLQRLQVHHCQKLMLFPASGLPPNLHKLHIGHCLNIESFPQVGLPPSLESLHVEYCESLIRNYAHLRLSRLAYLQELKISWVNDVESFPADGSLPVSLRVLDIYEFNNLRSINCSELQRIFCLHELKISSCPLLLSFTDGNLPQSLCRLTIISSPLAKRCCKPDGHYVNKTSHITCLELRS